MATFTGCGVKRHILTPLRTLTATAPSGAEITFIKYADGAERELSWYQGNLSERESVTMWQAKLKAERPGVDKWNEAVEILARAGWVIDAGRAGEGILMAQVAGGGE